MDVDDDNGAAPMLVEPRPAEDHLQPMSDELDGDGAPSTEDGVLLLPRGLFDALDDDDAAADFPSRRRETMSGDASDDESVDSLLDSDSDSEDDVASWALDSVRLFREQNVEPPAVFSPQLIRSCSRYTSTNARLLICEFIYTQSSPHRPSGTGLPTVATN